MKRAFIIIVVFAGVAAIFYFYIMRDQQSQMWRNEGAAVLTLREIARAQEMAKTHYAPSYFTFEELLRGKYLRKEIAQATTPSTAIDGYYYCLTIGPRPHGRLWCCIARPAKWGVTGAFNLIIKQDGVIRYNRTENSTEYPETVHWKNEHP
jgi:hypothetical protein